MPSLTIFLKPRPTHEQYGTDWLPRGSSYGPFHSDYSPPSDATEEREFALPTNLVDQWTEFHRDILPLLVVPRFNDSADPRELYAAWCRLSVVGRVSDVVVYLMFRAMKLQHDLGLGLSQDPIHVLCEKLMAGDIFSLEASAIELKMNVNMVSTLYAYLGSIASHATTDSAYNYNVELKRRCSTWDRLCINSSFVFASLQPSLFGIPDEALVHPDREENMHPPWSIDPFTFPFGDLDKPTESHDACATHPASASNRVSRTTARHGNEFSNETNAGAPATQDATDMIQERRRKYFRVITQGRSGGGAGMDAYDP
ncbi:hypothetical protein B0H13DRAFT_1889765 [Mycena leptocephala]|nr:hypothetical protein B0H13DRAFT_1889765 [Mycena leptocephala]